LCRSNASVAAPLCGGIVTDTLSAATDATMTSQNRRRLATAGAEV
jgi:hypothetical protein